MSVIVMLDGQGADEVLGGYVGMVRSYHSELEAKKRKWRLRWEKWRFDTLQSGRPWYCNLWPHSKSNGQAAVTLPSYHEWIRPELVEAGEENSHFLANQRLTRMVTTSTSTTCSTSSRFTNNLQQFAALPGPQQHGLVHRVAGALPGLPPWWSTGDRPPFRLQGAERLHQEPVLREGMRAILPEKIRTRVNKLGFATPEARFQRSGAARSHPAGHRQRAHEGVPGARSGSSATSIMVLDNNRTDFGPWRIFSVWLWMERHGVTF